MCFYIDSQRNPDPRIATEDIISYKVGYRLPLIDRTEEIEVFVSRYQDYIYRLNHKQPVIQLNPIYDTQLECNVIHQGYHSYSDLTKANIKALLPDQVIVKCIIVKCIIPKGSTYYHNTERYEYVSSSLIVTNFLTN